MNDNKLWGKISSIQFNFVNVKGNCPHLTEKNSQTGAKITTVFRLPWKCLKRIIIKTF